MDSEGDAQSCSSMDVDSEAAPYECLTVSDVETMVKKWVAECTKRFSITPSAAKLLLQCNNWDLGLIMKQYAKADEFLTNNGLKQTDKPAPKTKRRTGMELRSKIAKKDKRQEQHCGVCWEEDVELLAMDCGHTFCTDCWSKHIKAQIEQSKYLWIFLINYSHLFFQISLESSVWKKNARHTATKNLSVGSSLLKTICMPNMNSSFSAT
jgi:hypothetical protein